jgi:two-component system chemotaxis sensor kinase CheA
MDLDDALETFIVECRELLEDMETALLGLEGAQEKDELVNAIFRTAHTIKGSSGLFSLDHIVAFTHVVESVLDQVRGGKVVLGDKLVVLLLACCDHMGNLVNGVAGGDHSGNAELLEVGEPLVAQLRAYLDAPKIEATQQALQEL